MQILAEGGECDIDDGGVDVGDDRAKSGDIGHFPYTWIELLFFLGARLRACAAGLTGEEDRVFANPRTENPTARPVCRSGSC